MRFLVDNALSPKLATALVRHGHDAVHVRDLGLADADDHRIIETAAGTGRILLSADTDFGAILAKRHETSPSFVLFREVADPSDQLKLLNAALPLLETELLRGAIVVMSRHKTRMRILPIST